MSKKIWITYAHADNDEGDFDYLVSQLQAVGVECDYDKVKLVAGERLWDQIADKVTKSDIDGWALLVTPQSIASPACQEELAYALDRALRQKSKSGTFPLIALVHRVLSEEVPAPLRIRKYVNLKDSDWALQIKAALEHSPLPVQDPKEEKFILNINGDGTRIVIELRPRFEEVCYWRIAVSEGTPILGFGCGPSGGDEKSISGMQGNVIQSKVEIGGKRFDCCGTGGPISSSTSAYVVIPDDTGVDLAIGFADAPFGLPEYWDVTSILGETA